MVCREATRYRFQDGKWEQGSSARAVSTEDDQAIITGYAAGKVEIRTVPRRQVYIGGVPVGEPFE
jgi:hypothetical protein